MSFCVARNSVAAACRHVAMCHETQQLQLPRTMTSNSTPTTTAQQPQHSPETTFTAALTPSQNSPTV